MYDIVGMNALDNAGSLDDAILLFVLAPGVLLPVAATSCCCVLACALRGGEEEEIEVEGSLSSPMLMLLLMVLCLGIMFGVAVGECLTRTRGNLVEQLNRSPILPKGCARARNRTLCVA